MPQGKSEAVVGAFQVDESWKQVQAPTEGRGRRSPIDDLLDSIRSDAKYHRQRIGVARYNKADTAKGARASLVQRIGGVEASGFVFETLFHEASGQYALVATYDPSQVTEEGTQKHADAVARRKAAEKANREKKAAEKAKAVQTAGDAAEAHTEAAQEKVTATAA